MIIFALLLALAVLAQANTTCSTGQYYNSNLSQCLTCATGCETCCDESICSTCLAGTLLLLQDTRWPPPAGFACSAPSTATPAMRATTASPAPITPTLSMGSALAVRLDAAPAPASVYARSAAMDIMPFPRPSASPARLGARPAASPPPSAVRAASLGTS